MFGTGPVVVIDFSLSLLLMGKEFYFHIDYTMKSDIYYKIDKPTVKLYYWGSYQHINQ